VAYAVGQGGCLTRCDATAFPRGGLMGLSDRLIVMAQGKITAEYDKEALKTLTEADVLRMASIED